MIGYFILGLIIGSLGTVFILLMAGQNGGDNG